MASSPANENALYFPGAAILDTIASIVSDWKFSLWETIEQPYYVMKSKMAAPRKSKRENRG